MDYDKAGCNNLFGLCVTFTFTVSSSWITDMMKYWSWIQPAILVCSEQLSATQTWQWMIIRQGATSSMSCSSHSHIPYPIHVSLTQCSTGQDPCWLSPCAVSSYQLHKRILGLSFAWVSQSLWAVQHVHAYRIQFLDHRHDEVLVMNPSSCSHVQWASTNYTNVAMDYNVVGCNNKHFEIASHPHTLCSFLVTPLIDTR